MLEFVNTANTNLTINLSEMKQCLYLSAMALGVMSSLTACRPTQAEVSAQEDAAIFEFFSYRGMISMSRILCLMSVRFIIPYFRDGIRTRRYALTVRGIIL